MFGAGGGTSSYREVEDTDLIVLWGSNARETHPIFFHHLLPNLVGPVVVYASLIIPQAMLQESFLSFLGIGIQPPTPTFGNIIADGTKYLINYWWIPTMPGAFLFVALISINLMGDQIPLGYVSNSRRGSHSGERSRGSRARVWSRWTCRARTRWWRRCGGTFC